MERKKEKTHRYPIYIPWFTTDAEFYDDEEDSEDGWISYIQRNLKHPVGEESPFPDSSWSYTRNDSPFDSDEDHPEKRSDESIHDDVISALYHHSELDASHVKAIVINGIVVLFGTVGTLLEKNEAERIVKILPGVWNVRNDLMIEETKKKSFIQFS